MQPEPASKTTVAVRPAAALEGRPRLFEALEAAFPVTFTVAAGDAGAEALIAVGEVDLEKSLPTLRFATVQRAGSKPRALRLGDREPLDRRIRGVVAFDTIDAPLTGGADGDADVLAGCGSQPVWTAARGAVARYRLASPLPELGAEQTLRGLFDGHGLTLIALTHFLREVSGGHAYEPPPLRATLLFDDPNLRWRTYGYIDYEQLLDHADRHGYHASMAMIPLDGGHQHRATVELFRRRPDRLSLVFHGNNHLASELMRTTDADAVAIAAQALRRVQRFEARNGLPVDRVMTPPHGMCSASAAGALAPLGFDALCAIHPLPWTERVPPDRPLAGWEPAEFAAGCAVIPRVHLHTDFNEIALRAYLDQPLVLYGHHDDLADGLDLLADLAAAVNGLGEVAWTSLGQIAASNCATRLQDGVLRVRPYSHRVRLKVPAEADAVAVEHPRDLDDGFRGWLAADGVVQEFGAPIHAIGGGAELRLAPAAEIDPSSVPAPGPSVWPAVRRAATEARDRLRPLLPAGAR